MFAGLPAPGSKLRRYRAVCLSVAAHLLLLAIIAFSHRPPINLEPFWLAHGDGSHNYQLVYFPPNDADHPDTADAAKLVLPTRANQQRRNSKPSLTAKKPEQTLADAEPSDHDAHAGSPLGTMIDGPITGHEVHIAYPTVYPNPPVDRTSLPRDVVGDVVIEVTIDSQGNVVETKIVQAIGHGIDEKVEATLRQWHFQPATLDGTPVASKHDVHFHFPS
jgi:periplasmic protein TonB